jgi:uroporphyrinogen decarboxylase
MTSRQRVLAALNHQPTDKVPIDFGAMRCSGIHALVYNQLTRHLGISSPGAKVYDVYQMLAEPEEEVLEYFGSDVVQLMRLRPALGLRIDHYVPGKLADGSRAFFPADYAPRSENGDLLLSDKNGLAIAKMPEGGFYFEKINPPLAAAASSADIDAYSFRSLDADEERWLDRESARLARTDKAVLGSFGGAFLEAGNAWFGMEEFFIRLLKTPKLVKHFFTRLLEAYIADFDRYRAIVQDRVQIIQVSDDLGCQSGPLISEELYCRLIKPFHRRLYGYIRENSDMKLLLHSCGSITAFLPHLVEMGVQAVNPVQYQARDMDTVRLKKEFGREITFWGGGCDTQRILVSGSPEEVRAEAEKQIKILAPGGGFVFTQVHNIQPGVPPENIVALYEAADSPP